MGSNLKIVAGFSRYHKYTLGSDLRNQSRTVVGLVVKANAARDKRPDLLALREALDGLLVTARIAKEAWAFKSFSPAISSHRADYAPQSREKLVSAPLSLATDP